MFCNIIRFDYRVLRNFVIKKKYFVIAYKLVCSENAVSDCRLHRVFLNPPIALFKNS